MLSKYSVKKPFTVLVAVVMVLILGYISFTKMTTDLLPSMNFPYLIIMTTYPGASPETVETTVTKTVEEVAAGTSNIKELSSISYENYSMVICEFNDGTDMDSVLLEVREGLDQVMGYMPDTVGDPILMQVNPDMIPVLMVAVDSDEKSATELADFTESTLISNLESVEGVASASASGEIEESIQVFLRQEKIDALNEKIQTALDEKFADAESALAEAQAQVDSGKAALEEGENQLETTLPQAESALSSAQLEMYEKSGELSQALTELETQEQQLLVSQTLLEATKAQLVNLQTQLTEIQDQLNSAVDPDPSELPDGVQDAVNEMTDEQIEQIRTALVALGMPATNTVEEMQSFITDSLAQVQSGLDSVTEGEAQITAGKAQINDGLAQIQAGKTEISSQLAAISSAKAAAENQLTSGTVALALGESQLEEQKSAYETAKEQAYSSADMNSILTLDTLSGLLTAQNFSMPAGYITEDGVEYMIRVGDSLDSVEDLENMVLMDLGFDEVGVITLSDVADVVVTDNSDEVYARLNGDPAVILSIEKQDSFSTAEVSDAAQARMDELEEEYPDLQFTVLMDQGIYIDMIVQSVLQNMIYGGLLAILVLLLFLLDWRPTIIIACSIPISILTALVLMYFTGITMNMISLSGLALGVGMLVDNSIVVIENIYRLRQEGQDRISAAVNGAKGVSGAIVASTLTTVVVFLPIVFIEGTVRELFTDLALTIAFALLASLVVALTLVPVMSAGLLKSDKTSQGKVTKVMQEGYGKAIRWSLKHKYVILPAVVILLAVSVAGAFSRGMTYIPSMNSNQISVSITMPEGSVMQDTAEMADEVSERLLQIDGIETVGAMVGSAGILSSGGDDQATIYVLMSDDFSGDINDVGKEIESSCSDLDCEISADSSSMDMSSLTGDGISVELKGKDLDELETLAKQTAEVLEAEEGLVDIDNGVQDTTPEVDVIVDKEKAAEYGLTVAQVYAAVASNISSTSSSGTLSTPTKDYDIYLYTEEQTDTTKQDIYDLMITGTKDQESVEVPITDIAEITEKEGMSSITHDGQQRTITVSAAVDDDHNVTLIANDLEDKLAAVDLPSGYTMELTGENETIQTAMHDMYLMIVLAVAFMYLLMVAQFQSLLSPFIILFTVPLAFTGGFGALFLAGREVSIIGMLGFVVLTGVIVNNGIVLVDYVNQLVGEGMDQTEALVLAGRTRLRPILMTALTTIIGLSIMATSTDMGADMTRDLALVVIGGMIYGTLLTLVVVPCIYDLLHFKRGKKSSQVQSTDK